MLCTSIYRQSYIYSKPLRGHVPAAVRAEALGSKATGAKEPPHPRLQDQSIKFETPPQLRNLCLFSTLHYTVVSESY